ncbi:MAG TPA: type I-C CRISPR-associated endonuclease Cas1c [Roseateles sp.]|uniref:type I-C CRISPR-associated endonuclease Cas1c n=1 Tax=Roseateles sp. TaxID=1971397 RepID=UPI002EDBA4DC
MHLLNTLYLTTPDTYLRLENQTLAIEQDQTLKLRVPLQHLAAVVCFGHIQLSTPLMHQLAQQGIALVLLDANGRFQARLEGPTAGNVLLRQAQHRAIAQMDRTLPLARSFVAGKIRNARSLLLRGAREARTEADAASLTRQAQNLAASLRALPDSATLDAIRGIEGEAARQHFAGLSLLVRLDAREHFSMQGGRSRRPPRDRLNALLSFLYSLWMNDCRSALEAAGLDPQIGFLHALRPGRAALALDLMEEFRPQAERLALTLINRQQLRADDFLEREGGAFSMHTDARKGVLVAFQERKQELLQHPLLSQPVAQGLIPLIQARLLARAVREEINADGQTCTYVPFLIK